MVGRQQVKKCRFRLNKCLDKVISVKLKRKKNKNQSTFYDETQDVGTQDLNGLRTRMSVYEICTHPYLFFIFSKRSRNNEAERVLVDPNNNNSTEHSEIKCKLNITKPHPSPKLQS